MSRPVKPRVVKLGGSLLESEGLFDRLRRWLAAEPPAPTVLVVGGNGLVEAIRQIDRAHGLGKNASHWLSIDCMEITAQVVAQLLPHASLVDCWGELLEAVGEAGGSDEEIGPIVFRPRAWLHDEEPEQPGTPLPHGWQVTSDSIAARLAEVLEAGELVLLKPIDPPEPTDAASLAEAGYVDEHFPAAAAHVPLRVVNLGGKG